MILKKQRQMIVLLSVLLSSNKISQNVIYIALKYTAALYRDRCGIALWVMVSCGRNFIISGKNSRVIYSGRSGVFLRRAVRIPRTEDLPSAD